MISVFTFVGDWFRVENVEYHIHHVTWHTLLSDIYTAFWTSKFLMSVKGYFV